MQLGKSPFKGFIFADAPGLGKTLSASITISALRQPGDGPSLVISPGHTCENWKEEIARFSSQVMRHRHIESL